MNYENRVILFLDILGFKNILDKTIDDSGHDDPKRITHLYDTLSLLYDEASWKNKSIKTSREITQFSDSIVISFLENDKSEVINFFDDVLSIITQLVFRGILPRGAVAYGKLVHKNRIVFGPALVDAYMTESKAAIFPRIILDKSVLETIREMNELKELSYINKSDDFYLKKDLDEKLYFEFILNAHTMFDPYDYVFVYLPKIRKMIIEGLKFKSPDVKIKYGWLLNKYNSAIETLKKNPFSYNIKDDYDIGQLNSIKAI